MSQDAQVAQLCSIIPMLNTTIQRQNAIIDKLVESLDQKNKELGHMDVILTEIKTIKDDIKNVKQELIQEIKQELKTEVDRITPPIINDELITKEDLIAANMQLKISPDILSDIVKQIKCLYITYESGELLCGVSLIGSRYIEKFAKTFNLVRSDSYDWYNISVKDMFTHGNSSFVVPYKWSETYFPGVLFETKLESSTLKYIRSNICNTEMNSDIITMYFWNNITNTRLYNAFAKSRSTTYDVENGTIKLFIKQYADLLEETK